MPSQSTPSIIDKALLRLEPKKAKTTSDEYCIRGNLTAQRKAAQDIRALTDIELVSYLFPPCFIKERPYI